MLKMGTRNLTIVIQDNEVKMAQYGQWDGYLSGLGWDLILFLKNKEYVSAIKKNLHRLKNFHDSEELEAVIKENGFEFGDVPTISRDCSGADLFYAMLGINSVDGFSDRQNDTLKENSDKLKIVEQKLGYIPVIDYYDFVKDSLFNEYTYVIDLDNNKLEIYQGFNQKPLENKPEERFYKEQFDKDGKLINDGSYYPVKHWFTLTFDKLSSLTIEDIDKMEQEGETL